VSRLPGTHKIERWSRKRNRFRGKSTTVKMSITPQRRDLQQQIVIVRGALMWAFCAKKLSEWLKRSGTLLGPH
jgi:hypothetical protein